MYPAGHEETTRFRKDEVLLRFPSVAQLLTASLTLTVLCGAALGQAGRRSDSSSQGGVLLSVVAKRDNDSGAPITGGQLAVSDNGVQQAIRNLSRDPSPARLVLLVDNSLPIRADVEKLEEAAL